MLDIVTFVLACVPIVAGLMLVLFSLKERSRTAGVPMKAGDPTTPDTPRGRSFPSEAAKHL
jgi:hypothetical protein